MSFFISDALANTAAPAAAAGQQSNPMSFFVTFGLLIVIFYFLLLRPQQKRQKAQRDLINGVAKGDEIVTTGGLLGKITQIEQDNNYIVIEIAEGIEVKIQKVAIAASLPKGTIKAAK